MPVPRYEVGFGRDKSELIDSGVEKGLAGTLEGRFVGLQRLKQYC